MKYVSQLTIEDVKNISQLCLEGEKNFDHHYCSESMLVVMRDKSEFYINDFYLECGYNNQVNSELYRKYMYSKFGDVFVEDYISSLYDSKIKDLEQQLLSLQIQKQDELSELKKEFNPK